MLKISNDLTILIKTIFRAEALDILLKSIRNYYPNVKIYIADDSGRDIDVRRDVDEYFLLPFDSGISYGRNYLVDKVKTKYFMLLDDDTVFTKYTVIEYALAVLEKTKLDLVAGRYYPERFYGLYRIEDNVLNLYYQENKGYLDGFPLYDFVPNFFIAKTDKLKDIKWDDELKILEHIDFFWRAREKLKCTHLPFFMAMNSKTKGCEEYEQLRRGRRDYFLQLQSKKIENVSKVVHLRTHEKIITDAPVQFSATDFDYFTSLKGDSLFL